MVARVVVAKKQYKIHNMETATTERARWVDEKSTIRIPMHSESEVLEWKKKNDFTINDTPSEVAVFFFSFSSTLAFCHTLKSIHQSQKIENGWYIYHHLCIYRAYTHIHHMQIGSTYPFQMSFYVKPELCSQTQNIHLSLVHSVFFSSFVCRTHTHTFVFWMNALTWKRRKYLTKGSVRSIHE